MSTDATSTGQGPLLACIEQDIYMIAAHLAEVRDKLNTMLQPRCSWEIEQTLKALTEACRHVRAEKQKYTATP